MKKRLSAFDRATPNVSVPESSIDELIHWLERQREEKPTAALKDLINQRSLTLDSLVELACVDLIGQRRCGRKAAVEDYVEQFPRLAESENCVLDLIDAELCVRREIDDPCDSDALVKRFPALADSIRQLMYLESRPGDPPRAEPPDHGTIDLHSGDESDSDGLLVQREMTIGGSGHRFSVPAADDRKDESIDVPIPIKPPEWMVGAHCIATVQLARGRSWLVKGRDSQRGDIVAMKVIPLPATLGRTERTRILDICERTSSVTHPSWVAPRIASIRNGHLAVVRPWVFGITLAARPPGKNHVQRLTALARIAFALSAAHRIGATHGSVKFENVVIDHQSNVILIDAASGVAAWDDDLAAWDNDLSRSLGERVRRDTSGLVSMIATECIESPDQIAIKWIRQVTDHVVFHQADACAIIGESLQSLLDGSPTKGSWWR